MWEQFLKILEALGNVSTVLVIISFLVGAYLCLRGFVPVLIRLGNGLWRRKIALLAKGDALISLENLLRDSKLFNRANILKIPCEEDFGMVEKANILLVYWPDWKDSIEKIVNRKKEGTAMVVYSPYEGGPIPPDIMTMLGRHRNVTVNNFRGRLLNDLVISMITTGYEKR